MEHFPKIKLRDLLSSYQYNTTARYQTTDLQFAGLLQPGAAKAALGIGSDLHSEPLFMRIDFVDVCLILMASSICLFIAP